MKWFWLVLLFGTIPSRAQTLSITISKIRKQEGSVVVALFNKEHDFLKTPVQVLRVNPTSDRAEAIFTGLSPGEYAISVFHDLNSNDRLDTNMLGIPQEGFGFSRNVMGFFGPPSFKAARITVPLANPKLEIFLRHY